MSSMTPATSFKDLLIWRKSHAIVLKVYALTATFPKSELFGLTSQMRRAAVSVPANILDEVSRMLSSYERTILASARAPGRTGEPS